MMRKHKENSRGVLITAWKEKEAKDNNVSVAPLSHGHVTLIQNGGGANAAAPPLGRTVLVSYMFQ